MMTVITTYSLKAVKKLSMMAMQGLFNLSGGFFYEVLHRCEGADLLKTEMEVTYTDPSGKLTDLLVDIDGAKIGVSVTRAVGWPRDDPYTVESAQNILEQKPPRCFRQHC